MAAYAAVISLKHNSSSSSREILEFAHNEATSLQQVLEKLNDRSKSRSRSSMERVDALEGQIRNCANKLEDFLEFHELNQKLQEDEEEVRNAITSFVKTATKITQDYTEELSRDDDGDEGEETNDFGVEMVGRTSDSTIFRERLLDKMRPVDLCYYSFWVASGCGRTIVARTIYEDLSKHRGEYFDCSAWVAVGPTKHHQLKLVLLSILAQVEDDDSFLNVSDELLEDISELSLTEYLCKALEERSYMIVLDDVEYGGLVEYLSMTSFPDRRNGSLVLLTTAVEDVAQLADKVCHCELPVGLFEEAAWVVIKLVVLGFDAISTEMEEAGKKIVDNCRSSLIAASKVLLFLLETDRTLEQWRKIAADEENPIFIVVDEISEISKIKAEIQSWDTSDKITRGIAECISKWVGFPDLGEQMEVAMQPKRLFSNMQILCVLGMVGIGKTSFTKKIFNDWSILHRFDYHVWITLGPKYQKEEILIDILDQIYPDIGKLQMKGDDKLTEDLCLQLLILCKRCLIVLDNLCSKDPLLHLEYSFPEIMGTTLVTTRLAEAALYGRDDFVHVMELLDKEESWCLLRQKVFARESCPPELEKAGRLVAEKCDGLPLLILTVADQLLKVEMSEENWNDVASGKEKSIFKNAHHQISKALLPSYQGLPQYLKPCFLYMAIFLEKYEIPMSNLTHLCIAEGFLDPNSYSTIEDFIAKCLFELDDRSLVIVQLKVFGSEIKTCRLHSVFWHLLNNQAVMNKFFHAMNSYDDCLIENMESHRRLCIRSNTLLGIKDVQKSMASNTSAHSFLCVGSFHQFPVPVNFNLRLLRVMNVISIRLYDFPDEVVRLVNLRYLGLTCNGKLPTSISNLWKLRYLVVKRYINIKSSQKASHLPVEIWDMRELEHLEITGGCLPNHKSGPGLLKLTTLLDVSSESCKKKVLKWIPNLKVLGVQVELAPDNEGKSFRYLNCISRLRRLESLKCVVVNPQMRSEISSPPAPISMFPQSLKKLSLSGLGYPWGHMDIIGRLENLEVLKLKRCAFVGPKWEMDRTSPFKKLKSLTLEDINLLHWKVNMGIIAMLEHLCIKHCYRLRELPFIFPITPYTKIEIIDCSSFTATWAERIELTSISKPEISLSWIADEKPRMIESQ